MKKLILVSGKATSGKDTFIKFLTDKKNLHCKRFAFADNLKQLAKDLFNWHGEKDTQGRDLLIKIGQIVRGEITMIPYGYKTAPEQYYFINYEGKRIEDYAGYNNLSLHEVFIALEHYFTFKKEFWCEKTKDQIIINKDSHEYIFISDVRFESEVIYMKMVFSDIITVRIERPGIKLIDDRSEKDLDNYKFDFVFNNNQSLQELENDALLFFTMMRNK